MQSKLRGWLFLALVLCGSLWAVTALRQLFIDPIDNPATNVTWLIVQLLPLLIPLPGLLRGRTMSTFLLCMASLLYFTHGIMVVFDPNLMLVGLFEAGFALGLCAVTAYLVRELRA